MLDAGWNICLNKRIKQTVDIFSTVNRILTYLNGGAAVNLETHAGFNFPRSLISGYLILK